MKRTKLAASFLLVATLFLTGCVTKKEFVNLQTDYNKLKDEKSALDKSYQDAQIQLAEYRTQSKSLEDRLSEARKRTNWTKLLSKTIPCGNIFPKALLRERWKKKSLGFWKKVKPKKLYSGAILSKNIFRATIRQNKSKIQFSRCSTSA